ncbi:MAG: hypothetical protein CMA50_04930 [Euryarchaeota archaeon]|jgi:Lon protease-like protein|nr:hypothetical protein [Euryarchaeota archaeon]
MAEVVTVPLFVLPMGIFPMCQEPLRVFEPRYKQMLDDCVLNNSDFGYIAANIEGDSENGWTLPAEYGVLTSPENLQEQGTNLMFTAFGEKRFRVLNIIPAALSAEDFGDVFPSVDELVEQYIEEDAEGKLYIRAEIEILEPIEGVIDNEDWIEILEKWAWQIVEMSSLFRNEVLSLSEVFSVLQSEFSPYSEYSLWFACHSLLDSIEDRQSALASTSSSEIQELLEKSLVAKNTQLGAIRSIMDNE